MTTPLVLFLFYFSTFLVCFCSVNSVAWVCDNAWHDMKFAGFRLGLEEDEERRVWNLDLAILVSVYFPG